MIPFTEGVLLLITAFWVAGLLGFHLGTLAMRRRIIQAARISESLDIDGRRVRILFANWRDQNELCP